MVLQLSNKMNNKFLTFLKARSTLIVTFLGLYLLSAGSSLVVFSYLAKGSVSELTEDLKAKIELAPKTEECPINGKLYTKIERDIWENRRPIAAMVENHADARPLSGISKADVVYEANAEGGITRFLGVFYCGASAEDLRLAVIRSARVYFIKWAAEYGQDPIFLHWGGANNICNNCPGGVKPKGEIAPKVNAYSLLDDLGWARTQDGNDFDGGYSIGYPMVVRLPNRISDQDAAQEHQPVAFLNKIWEEAASRGYGYKDDEGNAWTDDFKEWLFVEDSPLGTPKATKISFNPWSDKGEYAVTWTYDSANNRYLRENGGKPFTDFDFENSQVGVKNVIVQFVEEEVSVDKEHHNYYENVGEGDILYFANGDVIEGTWEKEDITERTVFFDENGKELKMVAGEIWITAVPTGSDVNYN